MALHPDGPRTLWTQIRDSLPLTSDAVARGLELEQGRHPTMTEVRQALGLDLNPDAAWQSARDVRLPRDETPSDEQLTHYIDSMYRGLQSSRLVRIKVSDEGLEAVRAGDAIPLREGERLHVLVLVDNGRAEAVSFSAHLGGSTVDGEVEPQRTASRLLDVGEMAMGVAEVQLEIECDGKPAVQAIPVEVAASWTLNVDVLDDETGEAVAARVYLSDALGPAWPDAANIRRDEHENAFFHADGSFEARVSGEAKLIVVRGMEYEPLEMTVAAPDGERRSEIARQRRWSHMAEQGWWSGDVHVHLHYGGEYLLQPEDASLVQRGEDVNFMNMMVANQGSAFVHDEHFFSGSDHQLSDAEHILRWGEEYRNDFYGHLCMYGLVELVPPIYSGFRLSEHPHDLPANSVAADHCHKVGGTLSYAHPLFGTGDLDRVFTHPRTVEAKELPVDIALGNVDALDVMSYPGSDLETSELWYRLLNCGFRLPATAGTDTFMNYVGSGIFSNPPAGNRVFVNVEGDLTTESWCAAVREGHTFVTNGPMLDLSVNGKGIGSGLDAAPGETLAVAGEARSFVPIERLELIVNGEVVATGDIREEGRVARLQSDVTVETDCWIALRALGPADRHVLGGALFAHTSPIYLNAGAPNSKRSKAARYFVDWIERLIAMCREHGRYPSDAERDQVIALFRSGQAYYQQIVS